MTRSNRYTAAALSAALALFPAGAWAEDMPPGGKPEIAEGAEMLSEGLRLLFQGLLAEGAEGWADLADWLGDLSLYEVPERLPNGDIIIRRKPEPPVENGSETEL